LKQISKGDSVNGEHFDIILSGADYHHTEPYWYQHRFIQKNIGTAAYLRLHYCFYGFDKKLKISRIMLCFLMILSARKRYLWCSHGQEPSLFYANFPSWLIKLQSGRNGIWIFLIPVSPGINDTEELREEYFNKIIDRFETLTQQSIKK
jgi:phytoene desaturase